MVKYPVVVEPVQCSDEYLIYVLALVNVVELLTVPLTFYYI